jgi:hypothetical protein
VTPQPAIPSTTAAVEHAHARTASILATKFAGELDNGVMVVVLGRVVSDEPACQSLDRLRLWIQGKEHDDFAVPAPEAG